MEMQVVFGEGLAELQRHHRQQQQQQIGNKERLFPEALCSRLSKDEGRRRRARPEEEARSSSSEEDGEWGGERKRRRELQSGLQAVAAAAEEAVTSLCVRRRKGGGDVRQEEEAKVAGVGPSGRPAAPSAVPAAHNGWHVDDIDDNLAADLEGSLSGLEVDLTSSSSSYHMSESLLSLPTLTVFKQEVLSPTSQNDTGCAHHSVPVTVAANGGMCRADESPREGSSPSSDMHLQTSEQQSGLHMLQYTMSSERNNISGQLGSSLEIDNEKRREDGGSLYNGVPMGNRTGLNEQSTFEHFQMRFEKNSVAETSDHVEDSRFQYVLAAATSIATKVNEETLTYLNQGQSYEIKLKKLGDLLAFRGKIFKSIIRICFHERRLQYAEREQLAAWQQSRPGDRVLEVDVPLSYGACDIIQDPRTLNAVEFLWDPTKEVGVYIKVNCISTEFTPKKHGGEKGVPFRIQVETYSQAPNSSEESPKKACAFVPGRRLHAAACQIKVFKLKGADRKHKQDREKILKRPPSEQEKYQPSYECTVLTDIHPDSVYLGPLTIGHPPPVANLPNCSSSDSCQNVVTSQALIKEEGSGSPRQRCIPSTVLPVTPALPERLASHSQPSSAVPTISVSSSTPMPPSATEVMAETVADCFSGTILKTLNGDASAAETAQWLRFHRFSPYLQTFSLFSGADLLRLSRDDLIQICGLADGIRLYNALHLKAIAPRLTLYVCLSRKDDGVYNVDGVDECLRRSAESPVYHALYLTRASCEELSAKVALLAGIPTAQLLDVFVQGPSGIHVLLTDDVVQNLSDDSLFTVDILKDCSGGRFRLLLKSASG